MARSNFRLTAASVSAAAKGDIANFIAASTPGGIEAQEKAGQQTLVASSLLPIQGSSMVEHHLSPLGFKLGNTVDDLFVEATLPPGWSKKASDHDMWSSVVDEKGRDRIAVFYKAAFYDRKAHMSLTARYRIGCDYDNPLRGQGLDGQTAFKFGVLDCGKLIHEVGIHKSYQDTNWLIELAEKWINENRPNWKDPIKSWED